MKVFHVNLKKTFCRLVICSALCAAFFVFNSIKAQAATYTWDGGGVDNNWDTCDNWSSNICPLTTDSVVFSNTSTKNADINTNITVAGFAINSGYTGTIAPLASQLITITGAFTQSDGTFTLSNSTTTFRGNFLKSSGTLNHNSGNVSFSPSTFGTTYATTTGATFNNVTFDFSHSSGGITTVGLGSDMTVNGNLFFQNPNNNGATFNVMSNISGTARTITVGGNVSDVATTQTGTMNIGNTVDTFRLILNVAGNLSIGDSNTTLYSDVIFSGSGTQTLTKSSSSASINSISDWSDTGSGNFALGSNVAGSMVLNIDDSSDFTFTSSAFTFSVANAIIAPAVTYSPTGASSTAFTALNLTTGIFTATASTTLASTTINGGTFNAASNATTTFNGNFLYISGTFNHNNGTSAFVQSTATASFTVTPNSAVFNNVLFDYSFSSGGPISLLIGSDMTINGSLYIQDTNSSGGNFTIQSNANSTNRILSVAGSLQIPSTVPSGNPSIGPSSGTALISIDLKGDFVMADSNTTLYADIAFSGSGTQTLIRSAGTINSASDWTDTGSGNLALTTNFTGSQTLRPDEATDFNFNYTAFTFTSSSTVLTTGVTFTPEGARYAYSGNVILTDGTYNANASTTFSTLTIAGGTFNAANATTTTIAGNFTYTSGTFNHNSGTMLFNAAGTLTPNSAQFNNVLFERSGSTGGSVSVSLTTNMTVNGNLILQNTNTNSGTMNIQSSSAGTMRTITVQGDLNFPSTPGGSQINLGPSTSVDHISVVLYGNFSMLDSSAVLYADLTFASSSTQTLNKTTGTVNNASDWFDTGSGNLALAASFSGSQTLQPDDATDFNFVPTAFTFTSDAAVLSGGDVFTPLGPSSYSFTTVNLTAGTFNAASTTNPGTLTIAGGTFNAASNGTTTMTTAFTYTSGTFNHNNGTIVFTGAGTLTPNAAVFNDVVLDHTGSAGTSATRSLSSDMIVGGNLFLTNTNSNGGSLTIRSDSSTATRTIAVAGSLLVPSTVIGASFNFGNSGATFPIAVTLGGNAMLSDSSLTVYADVTLNGTGTQTVTRSSGTLHNLSDWYVAKTQGEAVLAATFTSSGTLNVATGTLRTAGFNVTTATGGFTVSSDGNLQIQGGETISTTTFANGATMTYEGTSGPYTLKNYTYQNLAIRGLGATFNAPAALTIAGNLNVASGTLDVTASNYALNVAGNWANTGTFTPRSGTVTLNGTNQSITGTTTFYNLTKSVASPYTLTFGANQTQTVSNVLTLNGAVGNVLSLRSSSPGTRWKINPQGTRTLSYIDVQDSENTNGTAISANGTMVDSGNNVNWGFDSIAPTASNIVVTPSATGATITWDTDEPATSVFKYGTTASYGSASTSPGTSNHSVTISGLTQNTTYHYAIVSSDVSLNTATTTDATFTTLDITAPNISSVASSTTSTSANVTWNTDELSNSRLWYGTTNGVYTNSVSSGSMVTNHTLDATSLSNRTRYYFVVVSGDASNNYATSSESSFTTTDGVGPIISNIASSTTDVTANVTWDTDEPANSKVSYGISTNTYTASVSAAPSVSNHSIDLSGLNDGTTYYFVVVSRDVSGNYSTSTERTLRTEITPDISAPIISNIASTSAVTTATIDWDTDEPADSKVSYGTVSGTYTTSSSSAALVSNHSIGLTGLTANTLYYFVVVSKDASNNYATSSELTVRTTVAPDVNPPIVSNIDVIPSETGATITWDTDESATSVFKYGLTASYGSASTSPGSTAHSVTLSGLTPNTLYHYAIVSTDGSLNTATTTDDTFTTSATPDTTDPTVSLTAPGNATTVSGSVSVTANASDDTAVIGVKFYDNNTLIGVEDTDNPYGVSWNTALVADGSHTLIAVARDAAGNHATSSSRTVTTDNTAPVRSNGAPSGVLSQGTVSTSISVDTNENATCKFGTVSGTAYGSISSTFSTTGGTTHSDTINGLTDGGSYAYYIRCQDDAGNANGSDFLISFSVASDATIPTVDITGPLNNEVVSGTILVEADASDDNSVAGVTFYLDDEIIGVEDTGAPYSVSLDTTGESDGSYALTAVARDDADNHATSSVILIIIDNTAPAISNGSPSGSLPFGTTNTTLSVETDEDSTCRYSENSGESFGAMTLFNTTGTTAHSSNVTGLQDDENYSYYIKCRDGEGNTSDDLTISFSVGADSAGPVVSNILSQTTRIMATITWTTDEPSDSKVLYGANSSYGSESEFDSTLTTNHEMVIHDLEPDTLYHYAVVSSDEFSNTTTSGDNTFRTRDQARMTGTRNTPLPPREPAAVQGTVSQKPGSVEELMAKIQLLMAELDKLNGVGQPGFVFLRDLELNAIGEDVRQLQKFLNNQGFVVAVVGPGSKGNETTLFGPATRSALIRFQQAKGIVPAAGFFGPKTRGIVNGLN